MKTSPHDPYGVGYRRAAKISTIGSKDLKVRANPTKEIEVRIRIWNSIL